MTQEELAEATGVSVGALSKIERALNSPGLETLAALASVLPLDLTRVLAKPGNRTLSVGRLKLEAHWAYACHALDDETIRFILEFMDTLKRMPSAPNSQNRNRYSDGSSRRT
jgi:transcriptional regulator with XRE-family HTH domain